MDNEQFEEQILSQFDGDNIMYQISSLLGQINEFLLEEGMKEIVLDGRCGLHFFVDDEALTSDANLHRALQRTTEELWLDEGIVEDNHGEVTPETVATEVRMQWADHYSFNFSEYLAENLESILREKAAETDAE